MIDLFVSTYRYAVWRYFEISKYLGPWCDDVQSWSSGPVVPGSHRPMCDTRDGVGAVYGVTVVVLTT